MDKLDTDRRLEAIRHRLERTERISRQRLRRIRLLRKEITFLREQVATMIPR